MTVVLGWWSIGVALAQTCDPRAGELVSVQGLVEVQRAGATDWRRAALQDPLCRGDTIRVGEKSRAAAALVNNAVLRLDENTTLRLVNVAEKAEERSLLSLLRGAIQSFSRRPRQLAVDTPYLNATIEGTEFLVVAEAARSAVTVFEGVVKASNDQGQLALAAGQTAQAEPGRAPVSVALVRPRDAVQWALYYPPLGPVRGDPAAMLAEMERTPAAQRDATFLTNRASLLLSVGRAAEARADIERALALDPRAGEALALRAMLGVVQNDRERALADARQAVSLSPKSAAAKIALAYALQAGFDLAGARDALLVAVADQPENALAHARLAELWLMLGERARARQVAAQAVRLAPDTERTQVVLGFAALAEIDTAAARAAFERAIALDAADPLPRLGLGLALIRDGALEAGRRELEVAVALDGNSALLRAYLGKAYFEEKRGPLDADQYAIAMAADPLDPTAYLYDAIRLQTENRPGEALRQLQASIARNDNRAVYRGRLQLDQDRAARGTSLGRVYSDLGFTQLGLNESTRSLTLDPANASAHRFLSDMYGGMRRREIARVSELLQAQLLQDVNINPVQPSVAETNLNVVSGGGPAAAGFNEFTPLFERNQVQYNLTGEVGNQGTYGGEGVVSTVWDRYSLSVGAYHHQTEGWRDNHDIDHTIYNAYGQVALTPQLNVQLELRHRDSTQGDLDFQFDPEDFLPFLERELDQTVARAGLRYALTPNSDFLFSYIFSARDEQIADQDRVGLFPLIVYTDIGTEDRAHQFEGQYLYRALRLNVVAGLGFSSVDRTSTSAFDIVFPPAPGAPEDIEITHPRGYAYLNVNYPDPVTWTFGLGLDRYEESILTVEEISPKFGVQWDVTNRLRLRGAAFQSVKPALVANQSIEPTQVAGFNQLFDNRNGTVNRSYGVGIDWQATDTLFFGAEATWRDIDAPFFDDLDFDGILKAEVEDQNEQLHSIYLNWLPIPSLAFNTGVSYDVFTADARCLPLNDPFCFPTASFNAGAPNRLQTISVPLGVRYFHPSGFFAGAGVTYVNQAVERDPQQLASDGHDSFLLVDAAIGYRFPNRAGMASLSVRNLFDTDFNYQDDGFREFRDQPTAGPYFPSRTVLARVTLNF